MRKPFLVVMLMLLACAPALAAGCDPVKDRSQGKTEKAADDTIAACTGDIHKYMAQGDSGKSMLAAAYETRAFAYETKGMAERPRPITTRR